LDISFGDDWISPQAYPSYLVSISFLDIKSWRANQRPPGGDKSFEEKLPAAAPGETPAAGLLIMPYLIEHDLRANASAFVARML
jgi:hypothetical protein